MTLGLLLHPERASRLIQQKSLDPKNIGLEEVLNAVVDQTIDKNHKDAYLSEVQTNINFRVLFHLMNLAANKNVHPQVNMIANHALRTLKMDLMPRSELFVTEMQYRIDDFYAHPSKFEVIAAPKLPDGPPIDMDCFH